MAPYSYVWVPFWSVPLQSLDTERIAELDRRLVEAAKSIKILSQLTWPHAVAEDFLKHLRTGHPVIPTVTYKPFEYSAQIIALKKIMAECDQSHPLEGYIYRTAESYVLAGEMLHNVGKPAFTEISSRLYGTPSDKIGSSGISNLAAAEYFIQATDEFVEVFAEAEQKNSLTPEQVVEQLRAMFTPFFTHHKVDLVIDPNLTSKAAAGAQRVRVRGGAKFTQLDVGQLAQHEGFVHAATMISGREQPILKSMGLGAPRTTGTQEGLATFAELITNTMDVSRLRRIALRIQAMHLASEGADFIEVFRFFKGYGQNDEECFQSAARIFRGGDPHGGAIFTKDVVYLQGLMFLHTFLRKTIQKKQHQYASLLFIGRLTLGDALALEPFVKSGVVSPPVYMPEWAANGSCLAAYLCYSIFSNRISLAAVKLTDFADHGFENGKHST